MGELRSKTAQQAAIVTLPSRCKPNLELNPPPLYRSVGPKPAIPICEFFSTGAGCLPNQINPL
jgi:hypothetical protein